jgi:hypothetical protein
MSSNKYNQQIDIARMVRSLLVKPRGRETFTSQLNVFRDWDAQLKPSEGSPWGRLTSIPTYSMNEHVTRLMKFLCPVDPMKALNASRALCLRYVRLSILHDKALKDDGALQPLRTDILDPEDVENVWQAMDDKWQSWRVALKDDLKVVQADIDQQTKPPDGEQPIDGSGKGEKGSVNVVNISAKNVRVKNIQQARHDASIHEQLVIDKKKKSILKKALKIIGTIIASLFVALVTDIFADFGFIKLIKSLVYRIFTTK